MILMEQKMIDELTYKLVYLIGSQEKVKKIKEELFEYSKTKPYTYSGLMEAAYNFLSAGIATEDNVVDKIKTINVPISMLRPLFER